MKRVALVLLFIIAQYAPAVDYEFVRGNTSKLILVNMYGTDGTPKTGLAFGSVTATYTRNNGSADVDVTEATMTMGTWASGGWIEVDATNSPGLYQFGVPDAAIASGADAVFFSFKATTTFQRFVHASLIDVDLRNGANVAANTVQIEGVDATNQINTEADTALADYDAPTNAEMAARTVTSATYATASALSTAQGDITSILTDTAAMDTSAELRTLLFGSDTPGATASALTTAQSDITSILADTNAVDTASEIRTLIMGSDVAPASTTQAATAQADLDIITGTNGVTLATSQPNYAPATVAALSAHDDKLDTVDDFLDTEIAAILGDSNELQTRFANMVEADGGDWRYTTNALEQGPTGGGGGDATAANQTTILAHLTDIKGATWASTDSLENIRDEGVSAQSGITSILADTGAVDTTAEMRTFLTGSDTPVAIASKQDTAQADLDLILEDTATTIPGTLAGLATASGLATHDGKLDTVDTNIDSILADTGELQTRLALMIEADGADWRFDATAISQAPAGGGGSGDASEANQLTIIDKLDEIQGTGFDTDTDSLSAIRTHGDSAWGSGGSGSIPVNHDTGGVDTMKVVDGAGAGIENVVVTAYVKSEYDASVFTARGQVLTSADGTWSSNLMLEPETEYTIVFYKPGAYGPSSATVTPEE